MFKCYTKNSLTSLSLCIAVTVILAILLPSKGVWVNDQGLKILQVLCLAESSSFHLDLKIPLEDSGGLKPFPDTVLKEVGGEFYLVYPYSFASLLAPFYKIFGVLAFSLFPLICGILATTILTAATGYLKKASMWVPLIALCTPLLPYHWVYWEHTLIFLLIAISLWFLIRAYTKQTDIECLAAGIALALCIPFRLEMAVYIFAVTIATLVTSRSYLRSAYLSIPGLVTFLSILYLNTTFWGSPLGLHAGHVIDPTDPASISRIEVFLNLTTGMTSQIFLLCLNAILLLLCFVPKRALGGRIRLVCLSIIALIYLTNRIYLWTSANPFLSNLDNGSMASITPVLLIVFNLLLTKRTDRITSLLLWTSLIFSVIMILLCPPTTSSGMHFGPRILLPMMIPLILVSARILNTAWKQKSVSTSRKMIFALYCLLLFTGLLQNGFWWKLIREQKSNNQAVSAYFQGKEPRYIFSDVYWFTEMHPFLYDQHHLLYVDDWGKFATIRERMKQEGAAEFYIATRASIADPSYVKVDIPGARDFSTILDVRVYRISLLSE